MLAALDPKAVTAQGPKRRGNEAQGERPCTQMAKTSPGRPDAGTPARFPCSCESDPRPLPLRRRRRTPISQKGRRCRSRPRRSWRRRAGMPQEHIRRRAPLSRKQFAALCRAPPERDPEPVRVFPASRRITMPTRAACSTAARKSSPMRSNERRR